MHIHILGICGTFMAGIAALAKSQGHKVTGCDKNVYPPMSTQLQQLDIEITEGFNSNQIRANCLRPEHLAFLACIHQHIRKKVGKNEVYDPRTCWSPCARRICPGSL